MHDTLDYFAHDPVHRRYHHDELTFSLIYAFTENFILPLSPRRGRARQGLAAREDAGRPLAAARQPARALRLHVGAPGQEAAVHGRRARPGARVEPRRARSTGTCSSGPSTPACSALVRDLNRVYRERAGAVTSVDFEPRRASAGSTANDADAQRARVPAALGATASARSCASPTSRRCRATGYRVGLPRGGPLARGAEHRLDALRRLDVGNLRRRRGRGRALARPAVLGRADAAAARRRLARARRVSASRAWERPLGATRRGAGGGGTSSSASGRRARERVSSCWSTATRARSSAEGDGVLRGASCRRGAGDALPLRARRRRRAARPVLALRSPTACAGRRAVVDPGAFAWTDRAGPASPLAELVIYELHVGTFTPRARSTRAIAHLADAARARRHRGRADAGRRPSRASAAGATTASTLRAAPGLRRPATASRASSTPRTRAGLAVILDVVYNHLGPGSEALAAFGPYFTDRHDTFWGEAIDYVAAPACASGRSRTPSSGSATTASTGCGSTRCTRSSTTSPTARAGRARRARPRGRSPARS